jgi:hypothetical protein
MRDLAKGWGDTERPAKYETLAHRLGVTITTVGNLMSGLPSKRDTVRSMADRAKLPRVDFLQASGYLPLEEDYRWDRERYPDHIAPQPSFTTDSPLVSFPQSDLLIRGTVAAGHSTAQRETAPKGLLQKFNADYLLEVRGDSMNPHFVNGDVLLVQESSTPQIDQIVIAEANGQPICKRLSGIKLKNNRPLYTLESTDENETLQEADLPIHGIVVGKVVPV